MAATATADAGAPTIVGPQPGPQEAFLSSSADIAIIGGSVFGGKTWALTYEPIRHLDNPEFSFVFFRRTTPEIRNPGGMWDESMRLYPPLGGEPKQAILEWHFPSGARGKLAGLQYATDVLAWKGAQIALILFDQLEEFEESQFWYMLSRNRSLSGVRPYMRASCNPDPDSWLAGFLAWWIDQKTGYAIPERSGKIRWFIRVRDVIRWADSREELISEYGEAGRHAKSVTFILARLQDNRIGNAKDPGYESSIRALPLVEQERLLGGDRGGNWKIRAGAGLVFDRSTIEIVDGLPAGLPVRRVRGWDEGATEGAGDLSASIKLARVGDVYFIEDFIAGQWATGKRDEIRQQLASTDGPLVTIRIPQDPAAAGKSQVAYTTRQLAGYHVVAKPVATNKLVNAGPVASQAKIGNVKMVRAPWNEELLRYLHAFPTKGVPDDPVDALAYAFDELALTPQLLMA